MNDIVEFKIIAIMDGKEVEVGFKKQISDYLDEWNSEEITEQNINEVKRFIKEKFLLNLSNKMKDELQYLLGDYGEELRDLGYKV